MSRIITTAEVKKHNHKDSVWMIIHNDVYDVTNFLDEHPGGEETLLEAAGKEASQDFEDVGHSEDARELMKKYKIGTLPDDEHNQVAAVPEPAVATCYRRGIGVKVRNDKDCDECTPGSCPRLPPGLPATKENKTWRTFDRSPDRSQKSSKTRVRIDPKPSSHIENVVVPKGPRNRGHPCQGGSNLKWYILALLGAIVIGVVIKKKLAA